MGIMASSLYWFVHVLYIVAFSSILPDSHQKKRQKTRVMKRTTNPVFNHTMVYEGLRPEDLGDICVELTVWNHDRLSNHFLGGTRLNLGTGGRHNSPFIHSLDKIQGCIQLRGVMLQAQVFFFFFYSNTTSHMCQCK